MPVVYADVVWLVNLVMDAVLLATCAWIAKRPTSVKRIAAGAMIGSLYSMLLFFPPLSTLTTWPGKAAASLAMVWVAVPSKNWLDLARNCVLFYFVAFVFAGAAIAMHFAIPGVSIGKAMVVNGNKLAYVTTGKSLALLVGVVVAIGAFRHVVGRMRTLGKLGAALFPVEVTLFGQTVRMTGLADTGNQLRHPVTGRPVCLANLSSLTPLLPSSLVDALNDGRSGFEVLSAMDDEQQARFSVIPFRAAGGDEHWLLTFRPDLVVVTGNAGIREIRPCLIGIHVPPLSTDDRFQAILHTDVIPGDDLLESTEATHPRRSAADSSATSLDSHSTNSLWRQ